MDKNLSKNVTDFRFGRRSRMMARGSLHALNLIKLGRYEGAGTVYRKLAGIADSWDRQEKGLQFGNLKEIKTSIKK